MNVIIQTPTPDLSSSLEFYDKLNFTSLSETPAIVSDGSVIIEINPDRYARAGVKVLSDDPSELVTRLREVTHVVEFDKECLLDDPSGVRIYLPKSYPDFQLPEPQDSFSKLGNFAGLSLETSNMDQSATIWKLLGFDKMSGSPEQGWISLTNVHGLTISLMKPNACPHLFFNPSMTYFNGSRNMEVIEGVRSLGIDIAEEITVFNDSGIVDNIIIRDPGGYGFFLFND